jgi:hypothetical protein
MLLIIVLITAVRDRSLFMKGGGGIRGGGICINKLLEVGLLNFFKKMRRGGGGVAIKFEGICLISMVSIWL